MISKIKTFVKEALSKDKTGHGFDHIERILKLSADIARNYAKADLELLEIACLLHDISYKDGPVKDHQFVSAEIAEEILRNENYPEKKIAKMKKVIINHVGHIVKSERPENEFSIESKILRDADNLDALGSVGLIRMISFSLNQEIPYFISKKDKLDESFYGNIKFLLDWPKKMLTKEGRKIAEKKVEILKKFLEELRNEIPKDF